VKECAMDITSSFKDAVKAKGHKSSSILPKSKRKSPFISKCRSLVEKITQLRDFLLQHKKAYLNFLPNQVHFEKMTEEERDEIDAGAQAIVKDCSQSLVNIKREVYDRGEEGGQEVDNQEAVLDLIEAYLKTVCKIFTEMKAVRVKWTCERQDLAKLKSGPLKEVEPPTPNVKQVTVTPSIQTTAQFHLEESEDTSLTEEELQMFQMENQQLYNELNSINDEVREIQSKVVKIAELQEVFTEKVLEQNEDIERINTTLIGTTENLRDANTQIRQAIQNNAGLRIYILFFLIVMSFSLLFLDWYND